MGSPHLPPAISPPPPLFLAPTTFSATNAVTDRVWTFQIHLKILGYSWPPSPPPHPATGLLYSIHFIPRFIEDPAAGSPHSLLFGPDLCQGYTTYRLAAFSLVHVATTNTSSRHRLTAPPASHRLAQDLDPAATPPHGVPAGLRSVPHQDPDAITPHGAPTGHYFVLIKVPMSALLRHAPVGPCVASDLVYNSSFHGFCRTRVYFRLHRESPLTFQETAVATGAPLGSG